MTRILIVEKNLSSGFNDKVDSLAVEKDGGIRPTIVAAMKNRPNLVYVLIRYEGELFVCRPTKLNGLFTGMYSKSPVKYHPLAEKLGV